MAETLQEVAIRMSGGRCGKGCDDCPANEIRKMGNGVCLVRCIAQTGNSEQQIDAIYKWLQKEPKLKPCPFCGGEAGVFEIIPDWYKAHCRNEQCIGSNTGTIYKTREEAIAAWDHREDRERR